MKVGIDIGGSHIAIGIIDDDNKIIKKFEKRLMAEDKNDIENTIEKYIIENIKQIKSEYKITQVGISCPGTIIGGRIISAVNLKIEDYNILDRLKNIELPIKIRNDAKCAAIAESKCGCLQNYKRSLFLTLGTGIGGAVIINGELLNTGNSSGCEFGHMIIQKDGLKCNCGNNGCFEKYASMKTLKDNLRNELKLDKKISGKELLEIIKDNPQDEKINKIINDFIDYLSIGISNLINIFEPEVIGIGGSFVYFSDILLKRLKFNIKNNNYCRNNRDEFVIVPAILGNDAGIIGSCQ